MILIRGKAYDRVKFLAQILLPAIGAFYFSLAGLWGLPAAEQVVGTIVAADAFLGVFLGLSQNAYKTSDERYTGTVHVGSEQEDGMQNFSIELPLTAEEVTSKKEIVLKVQHPEGGVTPAQAMTPKKRSRKPTS